MPHGASPCVVWSTMEAMHNVRWSQRPRRRIGLSEHDFGAKSACAPCCAGWEFEKAVSTVYASANCSAAASQDTYFARFSTARAALIPAKAVSRRQLVSGGITRTAIAAGRCTETHAGHGGSEAARASELVSVLLRAASTGQRERKRGAGHVMTSRDGAATCNGSSTSRQNETACQYATAVIAACRTAAGACWVCDAWSSLGPLSLQISIANARAGGGQHINVGVSAEALRHGPTAIIWHETQMRLT